MAVFHAKKQYSRRREADDNGAKISLTSVGNVSSISGADWVVCGSSPVRVCPEVSDRGRRASLLATRTDTWESTNRLLTEGPDRTRE